MHDGFLCFECYSKAMSTVKVLDEQNQILFECELDQAEQAWAYAKQMEEYGISVRLSSPSLPESLAKVLGGSEEELANLRHELEDEIDSHTGCCNHSDKDD